MRGKLPWWLVVLLGWVIVVVSGLLLRPGAAALMSRAKDTPGLLGLAWYMALLAGAVIAVGLVVAIVHGLVALASSYQRESTFAILAPPILWLVYSVLARLATILRR